MANLDALYDIDHRTAAFENHERGLLLCLAGPGTGKTFSLLARSQALAARGSDQDSICYLTFIKEIASAFIDDYVRRFGQEAYVSSAPRISTLHSFACRVIRNQGFRVKYDGELYFTNLADSDSAADTFLSDLLPLVTSKGCRTVPQLRSLVEDIKRAWQDDIDLTAIATQASAVAPKLIEASRCFRLLDWDHTIPTADLLLAGLDELPEWLSTIKHYFVDEYQDFNKAEQRLIANLAASAESMVIVGDDDQSLYSGRGGSPEGIRALHAARENDQVTLVKCYRCKGNIVTPTNAFQAHMSATPRPMTPASGGGQILCYRFKSSKAEVAFLGEFLAQRISALPNDPRPQDGIVCLFPSKRILNAYFEMLSPLVACTRRGGDVHDNRIWLKRVLLLLVRRRQRFIERLLLNNYRAIKPRHRPAIIRHVVERDIPPSEACSIMISEGAFSARALSEAQAYVDFCTNLSNRQLDAVSREVSTVLGIDQQVAASELDNLMAADDVERGVLLDGVCDALLPDTVVPAPDLRSAMFLTMHGSKGLTRKTVVIPGLEEACLPDGGDPAGLPEKQRLFFVAMSRATDHLLITLPHNRGRHDSLNFPMAGRGNPSSFIAAAALNPQYHQ